MIVIQDKLINLDTKKKIATIDMPGMPHLGSSITWEYKGKTIFASPNIKTGLMTVIDMESWEVIKEIKTEGPSFFMITHSNSPYAWVGVFFGPNRGKVDAIKKDTLEVVKTLAPAPGKTAAHMEFTKDGKYVLLSIWDEDGEVDLDAPRDRESSFEPQVVKKNQTRFTSMDDKILYLYFKGMTTRDIVSTFKEMYDADVSATLISRATNAVIEQVVEWQARPLDAVYPIVYLDCLIVKIRQDKQSG